MIPSPTQLVVVASVALAVGYLLSLVDRTQWRRRLERRFLYGVPWGTALTVAVLVVFYLFAQNGLEHWGEPAIYSFVSWSYFYPTGLLTAGIAHGSPAHIVSNTTATVVFGLIAEYTWGHYPERRSGGLKSRPWVRAFVVFPAVLFSIAVLTAVFSLGPGLGFSGAVYAIIGFTLVTTPRLAVGGVVATGALGVLYDALTQPTITAAIETGPPSPPAWAGVGFQAHLLGFLLGVLCAIALIRRRGRRPDAGPVFGALVLVGLVQSLWLVVLSAGEDAFTLYRGAGVAFVLGLAVLVTVAATGSNRRLPLPAISWAPSPRQVATIWIGALTVLAGLLVAALVVEGEATGFDLGAILTGYVLFVLPALPVVLPDRLVGGPFGYRRTAVVLLWVLTALVALVSVPYGFVLVEGVPSGSGAVSVGDYTVTYEENASIDRSMLAFPENATNATYDGLIVASDAREIFTIGERAGVLDYTGEATVAIGGAGWYETVQAERVGWNVLGNGTVYAVDLTVDGETTRSFASDPVSTGVAFEETRIALAPTDDQFEVRLMRDGDVVDAVAVPPTNESRSVDSITVATEQVDGVDTITVSIDDVTVPIAERETYQ